MKAPVWMTVLLATFLFTPVTFAKVIYVAATGGSDGNSCMAAQTITSPKASLQGTTGVEGGIACLAPGDTLEIRAGTYYSLGNNQFYFGVNPYNSIPPVPSGTSNAARTIVQGHAGDTRPIFRCGGTGCGFVFVFQQANNITFNGINIDAEDIEIGTTSPTGAWGNVVGSSNITISNTDMYAAHGSGFSVGDYCPSPTMTGGLADCLPTPAPIPAVNILIQYAHFYNWGSVACNPATQVCYNHAIYSRVDWTPTTNVVYDHIEVDSPGPGVSCSGMAMSVFDFPGAARASDDTTIKNSYFHGTHQALSIGSGNNIKIYNNVFANNGASGCVVGSAIDVSTWNTYTVNTQHTENTQIYNNTFYTNTGSYALGYGNPAVSQQVISTTVRNNIFYQNYSNDAIDPNVTGVSGYVGGTNLCGTAGSNGCQLNGIPNFVNAAGGNFQLNSPSPAIDTGATIALVSPDRAGVARPQPPGGAYDIGAYEFVNTTGVPHLASISPMSTTVGTASVAVTLTGTTLTCTSATLTITGGSGLTASNVACGSATTITATLSATSASVGTYAISATLNGTTATDNSVNFTVNPIPVTACNNTSVGNGVTCILSASAATTDGMSVSLMAFNATGANTLVMSVGSSDGNCTPSSTPANTWVLATPHGTPPTHRFFVAYNAAVSNSMTISCTATASEYPAMSVAAFSGIYAAGNPIDKVNGGYGTAATLATGSVTPSNAPQLVLAGWAGTETSSLSIDSGFTIYEHLPSIQGSYWSSALAMKTVSPAAATSATWTQAMAFEAGTTIMTLATNALPQTGACANTNLANGVTCTASASAISTDTITVSIPSFNPGSGSFLVLSTAQYSAGTLCHPTSTPSVNWQPINPQSNPAVTSAVSQMFYATGVTGTISITCNSGGTATASYPAISVAAFSGIIAVAPLDQFTGAAGNSPLFTKVVTPRNANQLIVAGLNQASVASTIDSGFAIHENLPADGSGNSYGTALAMKTVGTPAATSATWTIGSGSSGATTIATFLTNALPLTFVQQPTNTPSGQPFMPVIKVQVPQ